MFREARRIGPTLDDATRALADAPRLTELLLVDDGSPDDTASVVGPWLSERGRGALLRVRLLRHGVNLGKGAAVRTGLSASAAPWRLFMDADNSTRVTMVERLLDAARDSGAGLVVGSRNAEGSEVDARVSRRVMGRVFHLGLRAMGLGFVRDTQCGFKLYRADVADAIVRLGRENRFAFDLEHLGIARKLGVKVREVGVAWAHADGGTIRPVRDGVSMFWRAAVIRARLMKRIRADGPAAWEPGTPAVTVPRRAESARR